jgi:outer membrane protein TolC
MKHSSHILAATLCGLTATLASAQAPVQAPAQLPTQPPSSSAPAITLDQALSLARANEPAFAQAAAAARIAKLDHSIARSALLPQVVYHNQYLFTESNHSSTHTTTGSGSTSSNTTPQVFIANNAIHEYASQGQVTETLGLTSLNAVARADAASAIATAELEVSRRGLTSTVVGLFYASTTADEKVAIEQRAADEATDFVNLTQHREAVRESAHAEVIKAQLTQQQRQRDLADAQLQAHKARLDLGVLLFPDPRSPYTVSLPASTALPTHAAVESAANAGNPELASALASARAANLDVTAARSAYLPDLVLNYSYGIDAAQFAKNGPDGTRNLGYSASATLDIPVWDWFATQHRIKQAQIQRDAARVALSATQRRLIAQLDEFYAEADLAHQQLESLQLSVTTARESLHLTRLRYTSGEATVLEVVDAQGSLTTAELALQDGTVRYQLSLANLQLLTGTL